MTLSDYINSFPRFERSAVRRRLADACGVSEPCIKHYANGTRDIPGRHLRAIVTACGGKVHIDDLLDTYEGDKRSSSSTT